MYYTINKTKIDPRLYYKVLKKTPRVLENTLRRDIGSINYDILISNNFIFEYEHIGFRYKYSHYVLTLEELYTMPTKTLIRRIKNIKGE